jgi:GntR family transcriptional repressor for pyruvate dehydrogenase complex
MELLGILEIRRGNEGGAFILEPGRDSAADAIGDVLRFQKIDLSALAEARIAVERAIAELTAARATPEDFASIEAILDRADERIARGLSAAEEGIEFHLAIARASRNPVLLMVLSSLMGLMRLWLKKLGPTAATSRREQGEHRRFLACLKQGRTEEAGRLIVEHLRYSKERLESLSAERSSEGAGSTPAPEASGCAPLRNTSDGLSAVGRGSS